MIDFKLEWKILIQPESFQKQWNFDYMIAVYMHVYVYRFYVCIREPHISFKCKAFLSPESECGSVVPLFLCLCVFLVPAAPWKQNGPKNLLFIFLCLKARSHIAQIGLKLAR